MLESRIATEMDTSKLPIKEFLKVEKNQTSENIDIARL